MTTDEIRKVVTEIACAAGSQRHKETIFRKKFHDFADRYPAVFSMACAPDFDAPRFFYMLKMRDDVFQERTSIDDASKEVGQVLFDEYVKPVLPHSKMKEEPQEPSKN